MASSLGSRRRLGALAAVAALATGLLVAGTALTQKPHRGRVEAPAPLVAPDAAEARLELVYAISEPNGARTTFLKTPAAAPKTPRALFTADHAEGYPPRATASADGAHVLMTSLPPGAERTSPAELAIVDTRTGARTVLATDAYYFARPILSAAGDAAFYERRVLAPEPSGDAMRLGHPREVQDQLVRVDLASGAGTVLFADTLVDLAPLGVDHATGEIVAVRRTQTGAAVIAVAPRTGALRVVAAPPTGRDLDQASLASGGAWVLLSERASGANDELLLRVPAGGGAPEALASAPLDEPPAHLADGLLVRTVGPDLVLAPVAGAPARTLHPPRAGAKDAAFMGASPGGRFVVARWLDGATQAYAIVDARDGSMRALPPPKGGDLFGLVADVVGFVAPATNGGAP